MTKTNILVVTHGNTFLHGKLNNDYNATAKLPLLDTPQVKQYYKVYDDIVSSLFNNTIIPFENEPVNFRAEALTLTKSLNSALSTRCTKVNRKFDVQSAIDFIHNIFTDAIWTNTFMTVTYKEILSHSISSDGGNLLITHVDESDLEYLRPQLEDINSVVYTLDLYVMPDRKLEMNSHTIVLSQVTSAKEITKLVNTFIRDCFKMTEERPTSTEVDIDLTSLTSPQLREADVNEFAILAPVEVNPNDISIGSDNLHGDANLSANGKTLSDNVRDKGKQSRDNSREHSSSGLKSSHVSDNSRDKGSRPKTPSVNDHKLAKSSASDKGDNASDKAGSKQPSNTNVVTSMKSDGDSTVNVGVNTPVQPYVPPNKQTCRSNILSTSGRQPLPSVQTVTPGPMYTMTYSSQCKGIIGENALMELISSINPKFDVQRTASTGHLADIHVIDYEHNIKYVVESKHKQTIIRADVTKFESDVQTMRESEKCFHIVGLFLSLSSETIVGIGSYSITPDVIYLTQSFINKETLQVVFDMVVLNHSITTALPAVAPQRIQFEVPPRVYDLVAKLRVQMSELAKEHSLYNNILENTKKTDSDVRELLARVQLKEQFIKLIDAEYTIAIGQAGLESTINDTVTSAEEERLRKFIVSKGKSVTKKAIKDGFPSLATTLGSLTKDQILEKYGPKEWQKK